MAEAVKVLEAKALKLTGKDRAELARILLLSLDEADDQDAELAWAEEADRRYRELRSGAVSAIPSGRVMQEARARLK